MELNQCYERIANIGNLVQHTIIIGFHTIHSPDRVLGDGPLIILNVFFAQIDFLREDPLAWPSQK
jgi:hypothetical protein